MHLNSYLLFKKYAIPYFKAGDKVLEIGANGPSAYSGLLTQINSNWTTLDLAGNKAQPGWNRHIETQDQYAFPIEPGSFDVVLSGQVIEHVKDIYLWMEELYRITKPGGLVITINPVSWPYHEAPVDCWRIYPEGMKALTERIGFKLLFSKFESLEPAYFGYGDHFFHIPNCIIPGISIAGDDFAIYRMNPVKFRVNSVLRHLPLLRAFMSPVKVAYDTITVAQKPA